MISSDYLFMTKLGVLSAAFFNELSCFAMACHLKENIICKKTYGKHPLCDLACVCAHEKMVTVSTFDRSGV